MSTHIELDYEQDTKIIPEALDVELIRYPQMFLNYCTVENSLKLELEKSAEYYDYIRSKFELELRTNPEKFCLKYGVKVPKTFTEATYKSILTIVQFNEGNKLNEAHIKKSGKESEWDTVRNAIKALERKKESLEQLVRLFGLQYFAGPKVPRDLRKQVNRFDEQRRSIVNSIAKEAMRQPKRRK